MWAKVPSRMADAGADVDINANVDDETEAHLMVRASCEEG